MNSSDPPSYLLKRTSRNARDSKRVLDRVAREAWGDCQQPSGPAPRPLSSEANVDTAFAKTSRPPGIGASTRCAKTSPAKRSHYPLEVPVKTIVEEEVLRRQSKRRRYPNRIKQGGRKAPRPPRKPCTPRPLPRSGGMEWTPPATVQVIGCARVAERTGKERARHGVYDYRS